MNKVMRRKISFKEFKKELALLVMMVSIEATAYGKSGGDLFSNATANVQDKVVGVFKILGVFGVIIGSIGIAWGAIQWGIGLMNDNPQAQTGAMKYLVGGAVVLGVGVAVQSANFSSF